MRVTRRNWPLAVCLALLLGACQPIAPMPAIEPTPEAAHGSTQSGPGSGVPPDVVDVRTLGDWRTGEASGTYRVVIRREGLERIQTMISVDWIATNLADGTPTVVASRSLDLLEDLGPIAIGGIVTRAHVNGLSIMVPVTNPVTGEAGVVDGMAGAPGELTGRYEARSSD